MKKLFSLLIGLFLAIGALNALAAPEKDYAAPRLRADSSVLQADPNSLDFGDVLYQDVAETSISIQNIGLVPVNIVSVSHTPSAVYLVDSDPYPIEIAPNDVFYLSVVFFANVLGTHSITINIDYETAMLSIPVSAVSYDPTIYNYPYLQDFEAEWQGMVPAPKGWKVVDNDDDGITWNRNNTHLGLAHSGLWTAHGMGNLDDYLISPPIELGEQDVVLKWWDKVESNTRPCAYTVWVSTGDDYTYAFTDSLLDVICQNESWVEHSLDLSAYHGQSIYIAFHQYYMTDANYGFGIDDISLELTGEYPPPAAQVLYPQPDSEDIPLNLELKWRSGSGGAPSGYNLYFGDSFPPSLIATLIEPYFNVRNLTPGSSYYWQVVPFNDFGDATDCPIWSFTTLPDGVLIIGDASLNENLPINPYYGYSYSQSIYPVDLLMPHTAGSPIKIEKLSYYWNGLGSSANSNLWDVYLGTTTMPSFPDSLSWIPVNELNLVYSGDISFPSAAGWLEIPLYQPFIYMATDNLVIAIDENKPGYDGYSGYFHSTSSSQAQSLILYEDMVNPDPAMPQGGSQRYALPNLKIQYSEITDASVPTIQMPDELTFIRNSVLELDFRDFIEPGDISWDDISLSLELIGGIDGFEITYLPVNEPDIPGQFQVEIQSPFQYEYLQNVRVTVRNVQNDFSNNTGFTLHLLQQFSPSFATQGDFQYTGQSVQFVDLTLGNPNYWLWDFGDGTTSTLQHPSHIYLQAGIYDVSLTLGHLQAGEEAFLNMPGYINMQGTAVDPEDLPETWDYSGSPYNVFAPIEIEAGAEMYIDDGVVVLAFNAEPIQISGSLTAAGVSFSSGDPNGVWGGLRFVGSSMRDEPSYLEDCTITNALLPLDIEDSSPTLRNIYIAPADTTQMQDGTAIRILGDSNPEITGLELLNYQGGIQIENAGHLRSLPLLTNIRIRNSGSTSRDGGRSQGVVVKGNLELDDALIQNADTAIEILANSSPLLTNIRVRNSGSTSRNGQRQGIVMDSGASPSLNDVLLEGVEQGIVITNDPNSLAAGSPLLTNIRIRNSGSTSRNSLGAEGIKATGQSNLKLEDAEIEGFETGISIENQSANASNPLLTNIRIRNSGSTSRNEGIGIRLEDGVKGTLRDIKIENSGIGLKQSAGNSTLLERMQIYNCLTGIQMEGNNLQRRLKGHLIVWENEAAPRHSAFELSGAADWQIHNNSISGYAKLITAHNTGTIDFNSNIAWSQQAQTAPFELVNATLTANYNNFNTATPIAGAGNIQQNPLFVAASLRNYSLGYDSPCIDSGSPLLPLEPDGTRADMGAFSYLHRASMNADKRFIVAGTTVNFTNTSLGHSHPESICQWDLGNDGIIDSYDRDWQYHFATPGVYSLRLSMQSGSLSDSRLYEALIVVQAPQLDAPESLDLVLHEGNAHLSWQPVTLNIGGIPQVVEYYIVYAADTPESYFQYVGHTTGGDTQFTHVGGANAARRFYYVIGFNGSELELREYIQRNQRVMRTLQDK